MRTIRFAPSPPVPAPRPAPTLRPRRKKTPRAWRRLRADWRRMASRCMSRAAPRAAPAPQRRRRPSSGGADGTISSSMDAPAMNRPSLASPSRISAPLWKRSPARRRAPRFRHGATVSRYSYIRDGAEIYRRSFAIIRAEADLARFTQEQEPVAVRIIHACGQVEAANDLVFSDTFVSAAKAALDKGAPILCDSKMVADGVN